MQGPGHHFCWKPIMLAGKEIPSVQASPLLPVPLMRSRQSAQPGSSLISNCRITWLRRDLSWVTQFIPLHLHRTEVIIPKTAWIYVYPVSLEQLWHFHLPTASSFQYLTCHDTPLHLFVFCIWYQTALQDSLQSPWQGADVSDVQTGSKM